MPHCLSVADSQNRTSDTDDVVQGEPKHSVEQKLGTAHLPVQGNLLLVRHRSFTMTRAGRIP
jgi:hypothetical protein